MYFFFDSWVTLLAVTALLISLGDSTPTPPLNTLHSRDDDDATTIRKGSLSGLGSSGSSEPLHSVHRRNSPVPPGYANWPAWQQYQARLAQNPRQDLPRPSNVLWATEAEGGILKVRLDRETTELIKVDSSVPRGGLDGPIYHSNVVNKDLVPVSSSKNDVPDTLVEFSNKYPYRSLAGWALQLKLSPPGKLMGELRASPVIRAQHMMLMLDPKKNAEQNPPRGALVLMNIESSTLRSVSQSTQKWRRDPIFLIRGVLKGLEQMHDQKIWHGSLGLDSILVGGSTGKIGPKPWISDFGTATDVYKSTESWIGIPCFQAPEILLGSYLTKAVDVWAVAMLLVYLLTYPNHADACALTKSLTPSSPQVGRQGSSTPLKKRVPFWRDLFKSRKSPPQAPQQPQQPQQPRISKQQEQEHQSSGLRPAQVEVVIGKLSFPDDIDPVKMRKLLSRTLCWPHDRLSAGDFLTELMDFPIRMGGQGSYLPPSYKGPTSQTSENPRRPKKEGLKPPDLKNSNSETKGSGPPKPMGGSYVPKSSSDVKKYR